jgi:acetyl-CoA carboxylase biotin carboxyl carrier protein
MARERAERSDTDSQAEASLSVAVVHQLVKLMSSSDLEEITIEQPGEGIQLTLRKPAPVLAALSDEELDWHEAAETPHVPGAAEPASREVRAPLVGIFRTSMQPRGKPLVSLGAPVQEGQVVAAIEALRVYNEVEAGVAGTVSEILVKDGQAVEYGQPLFILEPPRGKRTPAS